MPQRRGAGGPPGQLRMDRPAAPCRQMPGDARHAGHRGQHRHHARQRGHGQQRPRGGRPGQVHGQSRCRPRRGPGQAGDRREQERPSLPGQRGPVVHQWRHGERQHHRHHHRGPHPDKAGGGTEPRLAAHRQPQRRQAPPAGHRDLSHDHRGYSSCRRHQTPFSLRPFGARSSHGYMPHSASRPRAYVEYVWYTTPSSCTKALRPGRSRV